MSNSSFKEPSKSTDNILEAGIRDPDTFEIFDRLQKGEAIQ